LGRVADVVMVGPGVTVSVSGELLTVVGLLSVTCRTTVVEVVAFAARGPEMAPVLALNVSPAGKPVIDQLYGGTPPVALGDAPYGALASPDGNEVVSTASGGGAIVIEKPNVVVVMPSATRAVKLNVPTAVGVPGPIVPVALSDKGGGSEPPASDHV
jgi:hypothetical protein